MAPLWRSKPRPQAAAKVLAPSASVCRPCHQPLRRQEPHYPALRHPTAHLVALLTRKESSGTENNSLSLPLAGSFPSGGTRIRRELSGQPHSSAPEACDLARPGLWRARPGLCSRGWERGPRRREGEGAPFPELQANQPFFQTGQAEQKIRKVKRKEAEASACNERSR